MPKKYLHVRCSNCFARWLRVCVSNGMPTFNHVKPRYWSYIGVRWCNAKRTSTCQALITIQYLINTIKKINANVHGAMSSPWLWALFDVRIVWSSSRASTINKYYTLTNTHTNIVNQTSKQCAREKKSIMKIAYRTSVNAYTKYVIKKQRAKYCLLSDGAVYSAMCAAHVNTLTHSDVLLAPYI